MFTRNLARTSSRTLRTIQVRPFSVSMTRPAKGSDKHAVDKTKEGDTYNIRESNTKDALDAKKQGSGGTATSQSDSGDGVAKAKKEFPAAPDPAIGMQDERGGKGY